MKCGNVGLGDQDMRDFDLNYLSLSHELWERCGNSNRSWNFTQTSKKKCGSLLCGNKTAESQKSTVKPYKSSKVKYTGAKGAKQTSEKKWTKRKREETNLQLASINHRSVRSFSVRKSPKGDSPFATVSFLKLGLFQEIFIFKMSSKILSILVDLGLSLAILVDPKRQSIFGQLCSILNFLCLFW